MKNNDAQLVQRTLAGDQSAFSALVQKYQKPVHTLVWRKIGDFHIAEEITQDIFLKVYKKLQTLKNPNRFAGWLYVIAARRCFAWCKKKRIPMKSLDAMSTEELEELAYVQYRAEEKDEEVSERQREVVKRLLQKLPESERTVVTLHYLGDMTCEDISQFLGVSPNTVKSRLHRARKRLKKAEHIVRENLGGFQFTTALTENLLKEIARIKPTAPSGGKPWMPWTVAASTTALVILMMGSSAQYLPRFQQPYSFDAMSETTVELVDTSLVLASKQKISVRNQLGNTDIPNENNGNINQGAGALQVPTDQSEQSEKPTIIKSRWLPMGGPEGTSGGRAGLFATSNRTLYAVAARGIYRLTEDEKAWTLICESTPTRQFQTPMAERNDILYILTDNELLASTDAGKTWETVGPRPEGRAFELLITDEALYLVFEKHIFRSDDAGKSWIPMMQDLHAYIMKMNGAPNISISDAVTLDNKIFIGTNRGLYRVTIDDWELLPLYGPQFINSLITAENKLYVIAGPDFTKPTTFENQDLDMSIEILKFPPRIFRSTDLGNTWVDISPVEGKGTGGRLWMELPPADDRFRLQMFSGIQLAAVGEKLVVMGTRVLLHSSDSGDTWTDVGKDISIGKNALSQSIFPVVALDENNFYTSDISGVARSTDAGRSWHPFLTGIVNSHVQSLVPLKNALCALTPEGIVKSTDLGESWISIGVNVHDIVVAAGKLQKKQAAPDLLSYAKIATTNDSLYVSNSTSNKVGFYHLSADGGMLMAVQGVPAFAESTLQVEWMKKINNAPAGRRRSELGYQMRIDIPNIIEERLTNGGLTMTDETVFMEFRRKLFRWRKGETQWFNTGIEDTTKRAPGADTSKGLTLAASQNVVYAGKRDGSLFLSLDTGESWKEITADLPFVFAYLEDIVFSGSTVYVVTDQGVMNSHDGINWHALTDTEGNRSLIARIAMDGDKVYGVSNHGVYRMDTKTRTWIQMSSEVPYKITAFTVDRGIFYIGTRHRGVLRLQLNQPYN
ncbi:sigma-70 family RNA polymerase sigma factor [Candidatus Poribacteria bacterium]|nr:sigma-70 family RNA polymerase sigma factor [Candidatus Poribacteria bacterium]MYK96839.1 sigma-70 family RNA polymerase sigma factor [Candidatus Poribacteria bacterium]